MAETVTFDGAPEAGTINFGVGQPSADLLSVELMRTAAASFLERALPVELNYGERQGDNRFRATLARFLTEHYVAPVTDREQLLDNGVVNSGGSLNHFTSLVVRNAIDHGLQTTHLRHLGKTYQRRVEAMDEAMLRHLGKYASWSRPQGGDFFWLKFNESVDTTSLCRHAAEYRTGFQPGTHFSFDGGLRNHLRLSIAHYGEEDIHEGTGRRSALIHDRNSPLNV